MSAQEHSVSMADVSGPQVWGAADNVVKVKHLYFSRQPDAKGLEVARDSGVGVVINMREPAEMDWDEGAAVSDLGMIYYNVPIAKISDTYDQKALQEISILVKKHHDQAVYLHCSSGNRTAAWLAIHLVNDHHMSIDESIELAKSAGLTDDGTEQRTRYYLQDQ